jgi:hypothetical protein
MDYEERGHGDEQTQVRALIVFVLQCDYNVKRFLYNSIFFIPLSSTLSVSSHATFLINPQHIVLSRC